MQMSVICRNAVKSLSSRFKCPSEELKLGLQTYFSCQQSGCREAVKHVSFDSIRAVRRLRRRCHGLAEWLSEICQVDSRRQNTGVWKAARLVFRVSRDSISELSCTFQS